jgi:hypothetical protein
MQMKDRKLLCRQVQEYIDELSQRQFHEGLKSGSIHEHIQQCPVCREYFNRAKSLSDQLDQWRVPSAKRSITAGVMAQIAQLESDRKIGHFSLWNRLPALVAYRLKVPVGIAAAVFIILAISLFLNITRLNVYQGSKENIVAETEQPVLEKRKFIRVEEKKSRPVSIRPEVVQVQRSSEEGIYFFSVSPEATSTPLVIILGTPGVVPIELKPQTVSHNSINQSL